jgi:hypothetical protein
MAEAAWSVLYSRLPTTLHKKLAAEAAANGRTIAKQAEIIIASHFTETEKVNADQ